LSDKQSRPNLDDRYTVESGRVFLTGTQALARLPMLQRDRDLAAGLNTAGFISGYRGSPLGGLDLALWKAREHLARHHVIFQPSVNEDLAATSIWGTQQVNLFPGAKYDGTFAMWYGKGPGVDRCGDVLKHANSAGTWKHGGVLAVAGDDHAARSSTVAHQSEHAFKAAMMPVLAPSSLQEYLDLGLLGGLQGGRRYGGIFRLGGYRARPRKHLDPDRLPAAARRPQHPLARPAAGARSATAQSQVVCGTRLLPGQQVESNCHRLPQPETRNHHLRQKLSRRAPGVR
jgi:hypothetical protein